MQDEQQFEQLMLQYQQLKNGSGDISHMIDIEDFDSAISMLKNREQVFINCRNIRKFLELTPVQQKQLDELLDEIRNSEMQNIKKLQKSMDEVQAELTKSQKNQKIHDAYVNNNEVSGSLIN